MKKDFDETLSCLLQDRVFSIQATICKVVFFMTLLKRYFLSPESMAGSTVFHEAGAFYLQEPAAMLPAEVLDPRPGERILDLCAAPGGKSTQIGLKMRGEGLLICNDEAKVGTSSS